MDNAIADNKQINIELCTYSTYLLTVFIFQIVNTKYDICTNNIV